MNKDVVKKIDVDVVPFFLTNQFTEEEEFSLPFYLYKVVSPCLNLPDFTNMISLQLVGEKTRQEDPRQKINKNGKYIPNQDALMKVLIKKQGQEVTTLSFLKNTILRLSNVELTERKYEMPMWEENNYITKSFIVGFRDTLRWNEYRFNSGNVVDILLSPKTFGLFELTEVENKGIKLVPKAVYSCNDPGMTTPLNVNLKSLSYPREVFENNQNRPSTINRAIRAVEWKALG